MMTDQTDPLGALVLKSNFWTYLYFSFTYLIQTQFQLGIWSINQTNRQTERHTHVHHKSLSTLSQKSATNCRRKVRQSPNFAVVSPFSATVALFCDSVAGLKT